MSPMQKRVWDIKAAQGLSLLVTRHMLKSIWMLEVIQECDYAFSLARVQYVYGSDNSIMVRAIQRSKQYRHNQLLYE